MLFARKALLLFVPAALSCVFLTAQRGNAPHAQPSAFVPARESLRQKALHEVVYEVRPDVTAVPPLLHVAVTFNATGPQGEAAALPETVSLQMPVWCPGDYHVQNFGKYVQNLRASDALVARDQRVLPLAHPDANTWTVQTKGVSRIRVEYELPTLPPGYFSENVALRARYVYVNGASALLYVVGHKNEAAQLNVVLPKDWKAETPLPRVEDEANNAHKNAGGTAAGTNAPSPAHPANSVRFDAPDYDTLADSPLVMAQSDAMQTFDLRLDKAATTLYRPVYFGNVRSLPNIEAVNKMLLQIARAETRIMGGSPNPLYEFLLEVNGRGGGLEHLNSCRLPFWPAESAQSFAPFAAHEFFHQWNIKRIRPSALGPFDYVHPPRTHNLWFAEGVTDYYAQIAVRRAGLWTEEQFLRHWQRAIAALQRNPARLKVTADEASWKVWESGDSQGYGGLSYYDKGALIGLCLDLKIRQVTHNRRSLDDVMRVLYKQYAPPNAGYGEDDLRDSINRVAEQDLTEFYNLLARSTQEMPFAECLAYAGLDTDLHALPTATPEQLELRRQWTAETNGNEAAP